MVQERPMYVCVVLAASAVDAPLLHKGVHASIPELWPKYTHRQPVMLLSIPPVSSSE